MIKRKVMGSSGIVTVRYSGASSRQESHTVAVP